MDLQTIAEISRLKYRYLRCVDTRQWDEFADTLTEDVSAQYGERLNFDNRDAVVAYLSKAMSPGLISEHRCDHPEIDVDGDTATGTWYLSDTVIVPEYKFLLRGASIYNDRYRRGADGRWRIAQTHYRRLYEYTVNLADAPSFRLTGGPWWASADEQAAEATG